MAQQTGTTTHVFEVVHQVEPVGQTQMPQLLLLGQEAGITTHEFVLVHQLNPVLKVKQLPQLL